MNRHLTIIGALIRKDLLSLWPLALIVVALQAVQVLDAEFGLSLLSAQAREILPLAYVPAYGFFLLLVIHQDAMASVRHDALTRPTPPLDLLAAKGIFIWGAMFLPVVLGTFIACLADGGSFVEALLVAIAVENPMFIALVLLVIVIAAVTATLLEAVGAFVGLFIVLLAMERWVTKLSSTGEAVYFLGSGWVILKPWSFLALISAGIVIWLQYARRNTVRARATLVVLALLLIAFPAPFTWNRVIAIQKAVAADQAPVDSLQLTLTPDCFPTTLVNPPSQSVAEMLADDTNAPDTTVDAGRPMKINPAMFGESRRQAAGQGAVAFATAVIPSGAPPDWKVMISNVSATYRNDSNEVLHSLLYARITPIWQTTADGTRSAVNFWLLPRDVYQRLALQTAHLHLNYSLSLLEPRSFELPVDAKRQYLATLGYCGATRDRVTADVTIKCFKSGDQPALVTANFVGAQSTEVAADDPDYTPAWLSFPGGKRYKIKLPSSAGSNSARVRIISYEARAHTGRKIVVPGVLGGPVSNCPAPAAT
jgi:hypothetical protein